MEAPKAIRIVSMFTGTCMLDIGVHDAFKNMGCDVKTVMHCECDPFAQEIIRARIKDGFIDDAPIWPDVRTLQGNVFLGRANVVAGGFPCQDLSHAGKKAGIGKGTRSGLFFDLLRIAKDMRSDIICLENVPAILTTMSKSTLANGRKGAEPAVSIVGRALHEAGYDCGWVTYSAADAGAPHGRERWWCIAVRRVTGADTGHVVCDLSPEEGIVAMLQRSGEGVGRPQVADEIAHFMKTMCHQEWVARVEHGEWRSVQPSMFEDDEVDTPSFWAPTNADGSLPTVAELSGENRWPRQGLIVDGRLYRTTDRMIGLLGFRSPSEDADNRDRSCKVLDDSHPTPVSYDSTPGGPNNHYKGLGHLAAHGGIYDFDGGQHAQGLRGVCEVRAQHFREVLIPRIQFRFVTDATIAAMNLSTCDGDDETQPFSTPKARDYRSGKGQAGAQRNTPDLPTQVSIGKEHGLLNPFWTEPLQGWPMGWTDVHAPCPGQWFGFPMGMGEHQHAWEPSRIVKKGAIQDRADRVKACGNGVVPTCATVAFLALAGHLKRIKG